MEILEKTENIGNMDGSVREKQENAQARAGKKLPLPIGILDYRKAFF